MILTEGTILAPISTNSGDVKLELVTHKTVDGKGYWWIKRTDLLGKSNMITFTEDALRTSFKVAPSFFQVGKTYKFSGSFSSSDRYTVLDVYEIDNPLTDEGKIFASAICRDHSGKGLGSQLSTWDFKRMAEVS